MAAAIAAHDWAVTPLGENSSWPEPLRTSVVLMLGMAIPSFVVWGPGQILLYNQAYSEILALRHPGALGLPFREVWPEIWHDLAPLVERVYAGEALAQQNLPLRIRRKGYEEETWFTYFCTPVRLDGGRVGGFFGGCVETTAAIVSMQQHSETLERRVAQTLAEKKVYADIVESSTASVTALDLDYNILAINRANVDAFERIYGRRPEVGGNFLELFADAPDELPRQRAIWSRALDGDAFAVVQEFGDHRYERRSYDVRFSPLLGPDGQLIGASSTAYDVTDRVRAEAKLAAAQEQLRHVQKMESIGQLTGGVAHDFNNLLVPIIGSLDMLGRKALGGERERRLIAAAMQSAERARTLVQRLLAFARRQPLQPSAVNAAALVAGMDQLLASTLGPQIRLVTEIAGDLPRLYADSNQLEMALLNLSVNARDAMPHGGTLRIAASAEIIEAGHKTGLPPDRYVRVSVIDTGRGMDEAILARAVEPFFSTKGVGKGTGLGLSMVDGLVRQLHGVLTLESQPEQGTRVDLWLPVSHDDVAESTGGRKRDGGARDSALVLIVDDEDLVRLSVADMLSELGYRVEEAASAEEALEKLRAGLGPDLVVTDHLMPGMTGTELARALAAEFPHVPALIVSGYAEVEGIAPEFARLTKPFRSDELSMSLAALRHGPLQAVAS